MLDKFKYKICDSGIPGNILSQRLEFHMKTLLRRKKTGSHFEYCKQMVEESKS